jgi:putative ABC transport system permease protein
MIVRRGLSLALPGAAAGMAVSAVMTRFFSEMLFHVQPADPLTFAVTAASLLVTGLAASGLPAYRAVRLEPIRTLREQ